MTTFDHLPPTAAPDAPAMGPEGASRRRRDWPWVALACVLLAASASVRAWQDRRDEALRDRVVVSPFPLKELPTKLGRWRLVEGSQTTIDPQISQIAGAADSLSRRYFDESTGVAVSVVVLFGRAESIVKHTPEVCYPAAGYRPIEGGYDVPLGGNGAGPWFRSLAFSKSGGAAGDRYEVYYAFRSGGRWVPEVEGNWRALRYNPGVYKIQTERLLSDHEQRMIDNPTEQFLAELIGALEGRIAPPAPPGDKP